jgi:hypothetical protein
MRQAGRQVIHWTVEMFTQCQTRQAGRQVIHWLLETTPKDDACNPAG